MKNDLQNASANEESLKNNKILLYKLLSKYFFAIFPLIGIITFYIAFGNVVFNDWENYLNVTVNNKKEGYFTSELIESINNWNTLQKTIYLIVRNTFMITTISNVSASIFWINSIINNKKEGTGKFDNYYAGTIILSQIFWVCLLYNGSLLITGAQKQFEWYNYISWTTEHSIPQFLMLIYFFVFYNKSNVITKKKSVYIFWIYTLLPIIGFLTFFQIIGLICYGINKSSPVFPFYGDMCSNGYYPYDFLDITSDNGRVYVPIPPAVQYFLLLLLFIIFISGYFAGIYLTSRYQCYKKKQINEKLVEKNKD